MLRKATIAALTIAATAGAGLPLMTASAAETGSISGVAFEDTDRDGVKDAGEPGWADQEVLLYDLADRYYGSAVTDAAGSYSFVNLSAGTYRVLYAPRGWWSLRDQWVPTTSGTLEPDVTRSVDGATTVHFGWRRIIRSASPLSTFTGPEGLRAEVYNDVVPARALYDVVAAGLVTQEAPFVTLRLDKSGASATSATATYENGSFTRYSAVSDISYLSWLTSGAVTVAHEYGHAWSLFHAYLTQQDPDLTAYLRVRGLEHDPRVNTDHGWSAREMLAEDYRQLLGAPLGRTAPQENNDIPRAADVPGPQSWLTDTFTGGTATSPEPTPSPSSSPTPSPAPTASPTPTPDAGTTSPQPSTSPSPTPASKKKGGGGGRR